MSRILARLSLIVAAAIVVPACGGGGSGGSGTPGLPAGILTILTRGGTATNGVVDFRAP